MAGQYPPPQRDFSPLARTDSPHRPPPGPYQPGIKRQQPSPNSGSPYNSPSINNISLPNQVFSSPYYGTQANGATTHGYNHYQQQHPPSRTNSPHNHSNIYSNNSPQAYSPSNPYNPYMNNTAPTTGPVVNNSYNTINPPAASHLQSGAAGQMGPPSRPPAAEKPMDVNDLSDVIAGSGIDLKEEEANLITYNSLKRDTSSNSYDYRNSFYSPNVPGGRDSFYGSGTFNQPASSNKTADEILAEALQKAICRKAEVKSYHLNDPFVFAANLRRRLAKQALNMQVNVPTKGLFHAQPNAPPRQLVLQGPDKNDVLKTVTNEDLLSNESQYVEFLSLLSLAAEERVRGFVEDAAVLAKGRRNGSRGLAPPDMVDLSASKEAPETTNGLPTPGNSAVSPTGSSLKRSYADMNKPLTPASARSNTPVLHTPVAQVLNDMNEKERQAEIQRLMKRQRRADANRSDTVGVGPSGSSGLVAPDIETKKASKLKDQKDAAARKATEAQQHAATTKTMNMALGLSGSMGKKLSWMKGAADATPSNPYLPKANISASTSKAGASGTTTPGSNLPKTRLLGEFKEDDVMGAGIQLRDMISVLEHDGKEKRVLQRAYLLQGKVKR